MLMYLDYLHYLFTEVTKMGNRCTEYLEFHKMLNPCVHKKKESNSTLRNRYDSDALITDTLLNYRII